MKNNTIIQSKGEVCPKSLPKASFSMKTGEKCLLCAKLSEYKQFMIVLM
jgi:hypothetical protein